METKKKYRSKRLAGIEGGWSDVEFLEYVMSRVDYRTKKPEIIEASNERFSAIIEKVRKIEASKNLRLLLESIKSSENPELAIKALLGESA